MNAHEMVITARLADHVEEDRHLTDHEPLPYAEMLFKQFKRGAPALLRFLMDSKRSDREIGDWLWDFHRRWSKERESSPITLKYFAEDELERLNKRKSAHATRSFRDFMREPQPVEAVSACRACGKPIEQRGQIWYVTGGSGGSDICLKGRSGLHKPQR